MKLIHKLFCVAIVTVALAACDGPAATHDHHATAGHGEAEHVEMPRGPHGGRLLSDDGLTLELTIFETGVPPEFRVWATKNGTPVAPEQLDLRIILTRLGGIEDDIGFVAQDDFLRGDTVIYEPHSFVVTIEARHDGKSHRWQYDNFEGRTRITSQIAESFGLGTEVAGPAVIRETVRVYGRIVPDVERVRRVSARFEGAIQSMPVSVGDTVRRGQVLAVVESNESLKDYSITAPIDGVVAERAANPGEQTSGLVLFTIIDTSAVWAELAVFPRDLARVQSGATATVFVADGSVRRQGKVSQLSPVAAADQSVRARVTLDNADGALVPGMYLHGEIEVAEHAVPLAVKRSGLQAFRDFTVVYAQIGDQYEVRMLDLGRQDEQWIEVLGGLDAGTHYVTENSYLVKADIEKSGASHDH